MLGYLGVSLFFLVVASNSNNWFDLDEPINNCSKFNKTCSECIVTDGCFWCQFKQQCASLADLQVNDSCPLAGIIHIFILSISHFKVGALVLVVRVVCFQLLTGITNFLSIHEEKKFSYL
jgi:hypothetical protein